LHFPFCCWGGEAADDSAEEDVVVLAGDEFEFIALFIGGGIGLEMDNPDKLVRSLWLKNIEINEIKMRGLTNSGRRGSHDSGQ
jgi:hypothetical protein